MQQERIGDFLRDQGVITEEEIGIILSYSKQTGLRFCEAGLEIKILTQDKLVRAFAPAFKGDLFNVSTNHMVRDTSKLLSVEEILKFGALPLGFRKESRILGPSRRKILNLGLLDPSKHKEVVDAIHSHGEWKRRKKPFHSTNVYLVLVDQFIEVLEKIYGVTEDRIRATGKGEVDPILARFLKVLPGESAQKPVEVVRSLPGPKLKMAA